jgi:alanine racemase
MIHRIRGVFRRLRKSRFSYDPLVEVRLHRNAIVHNYEQFKRAHPGLGVAPVLKSNAYGHGLVPVAGMLDSKGAPFICVDSFFEALILRNEGITSPILIVGYTPAGAILKHRLRNISFAIVGMETLIAVAAAARSPVSIHLKIDTGMHRHGIMPESVARALELIRSNAHLKLEGVYSHFADADMRGSAHAALQIAVWNQAANEIRRADPRVRYFHIAASAGSCYSHMLDANVMRLGIGLYGIHASPMVALDLHPALEVRSRITSIRDIQAGETVGYNGTFTASKPMRIATVPVGYNEGVDRRLSNTGCFLVHDVPCSIVGRVSMNITSIDVSGVPHVSVDDEVTIMSHVPEHQNSIENVARTCATVPHEILVHIPAHLRRVVVD